MGYNNVEVIGNLDKSRFYGKIWEKAWLSRFQEKSGGKKLETVSIDIIF